MKGWKYIISFIAALFSILLLIDQSMLSRLQQLTRTVKPPQAQQTRNMSTAKDLPKTWHAGPDDAFHGKITPDGPFKPEKDRYHLYIGLFCPFAHRANLILHMKQLHKYAGISTSIVKPYPKGDDKGWPGWQFNLASAKSTSDWYDGSTEDLLFGSKYLHEVYFKADPEYKGRYSVPVLWDKKLGTIVNNESLELLRDLQTAFDGLEGLPRELQNITLYPEGLREEIDRIGEWMQRDLNTGVYKAGFARTQADYEKNLPSVFAALNALEKLASANGGPYLLGSKLTELDVRAYATLIRFDTIYVQHFKCNLGTLRYNYPILNNWMKGLYRGEIGNAGGEGGEGVWRNTTDFRHIKENYTKSHADINPLAITPVGPWPSVEKGYERDWSNIKPGEIDMPEVLEREKELK